MPHSVYVCLQDEDKIVAFAMDGDTGQLTPQAEVPAAGGPSVMALSPDRRTLYVGHRTSPAPGPRRRRPTVPFHQRHGASIALLGRVHHSRGEGGGDCESSEETASVHGGSYRWLG